MIAPQTAAPKAYRTSDVEAAARALAADDHGPASALLTARGLDAPTIAWDPVPEEIVFRQLQTLLRWWRGCPGFGLPQVSDIDLLADEGLVAVTMVVDVEDGGRDFRYRRYGATIAGRFGADLTGRRLSSLTETPAAPFFAAAYRAVMLRARPLATEHRPPARVAAETWTRLVLPMGGGGEVRALLVGNVPGAWRRPQG
jgi:hypothetical protein